MNAPIKPLTSEALTDLANLALEVGRFLYQSGAASQRIIDSLRHICEHCGANVDVLVTDDAILVTTRSGEKFHTGLNSTREVAGVNTAGLAAMSQYLNSLAKKPQTLEEIKATFNNFRQQPKLYPNWLVITLVSLACAAFGKLNGGDFASSLIVIPATAIAIITRQQLLKRQIYSILTVLAAAFAGGIVSCLGSNWTATPSVTLAAAVLFLIPGIPFINAGIDIAWNHTSHGIARLTFATIVVCLMSLGLAIATTLWPLPIADDVFQLTPWPWSLIIDSSYAVVAALGFAALFNTPLRLWPICAVCSALGRFVKVVLQHYSFDPAIAVLVAVVAITITAMLTVKTHSAPPFIIAIISSIPMIPGYLFINFFNGLTDIYHLQPDLTTTDILLTFQNGLRSLLTLCAIAGGIVISVMVIDRRKPRI